MGFGLSDTLLYWFNFAFMIGSVVFLVYAIASVIIYLVVQDMLPGSLGNAAQRFTGQTQISDNRGKSVVFKRLALAIIVVAFVMSNGSYIVLEKFYAILSRLLR